MTCRNPCSCPVHANIQSKRAAAEKTRPKRDRAAYMRDRREKQKAAKSES